jgi:hypothetical protein
MNKKDRIAVVVSVVLIPILFGVLIPVISSKTDSIIFAWLALITTCCYWSYRFIKNDISFFKVKDE